MRPSRRDSIFRGFFSWPFKSLVCTSFYFQLGFGTLISGAIYVLVKIDIELDSKDFTVSYMRLLLLLVVSFGSLLATFVFLGCCGAACQNKSMIGTFIAILFIVLIGTVYILCDVSVVQDRSEEQVGVIVLEQVGAVLEKTIPYYDPKEEDSLVKTFWDWIQARDRCSSKI